jgi:hypothetical protein
VFKLINYLLGGAGAQNVLAGAELPCTTILRSSRAAKVIISITIDANEQRNTTSCRLNYIFLETRKKLTNYLKTKN